MSKRRKKSSVQPDEVFTAGPLNAARFGNNIVYESGWSKDEFEEAQRRAIALYPDIVDKIDKLAQEIAKLVSELPPQELLRRAWWELSGRSMHFESEVEIGFDDTIAIRMVDYIQSVIASVKPAEAQKDQVSDEDWQDLREKVDELFGTLNLNFQICRTAKSRAEDPDYDSNVEEFYTRAQFYWCNVRGARYQVHDALYLRDMFLPHSTVLQEIFGISADEFIDELMKIWESLTLGLQQILDEVESLREDSIAAVEAKLKDDPSLADTDPSTLMDAVITENGWEDRRRRIAGGFFGADLHDLGKVTSLPQSLIDELTWAPGEETDFFAPGDFRGWPLRIWPIFKRPFIRLDGHDYCFAQHGLFDNIYRVMQRTTLRLRPDYQETWNQIQQKQSEELPFKYLEKILPGATVYRNVNYRWRPNPSTQKKEWCEADGLLIYDDHLFIVEARAGAFTYTSPADDFPAFIESLRNLVLKPATQGKRFLEYLESDDTVRLFDEEHNELGELRRDDFRKVTICPVTLDPFTEMAAQVQHLRKIGVDVGSHPVWATSIDDLRVYADVFDDPLRFLHYVEQRMRAFQSDVVQSDDELDHLGLYLKHNNYALHADRLRGNSDARVNFTGYRSEIDKLFSARLHDPSHPSPLQQETPPRILEIISLLSASSMPRRAELAGFLLDLDGETREQVSQFVEQELLAQQSDQSPKPYSTHGGVEFTLCCFTQPAAQRDPDETLDHARTVSLVNNDDRRLLLELTYNSDQKLLEVDWQWVELAAIPAEDLPRLQRAADSLRETRVGRALAQRRKIGRNEPCPCGSGEKYKKCCLKPPQASHRRTA